MTRALLFALLVPCAALANERVRVAVHPIVCPGIDDAKLVVELNRELANILAETQHVTLVAPEDVEKRLSEEGGRCPSRGKERLDCLERLALATRSAYVIAVTVKRLGKDYELSGTIADADRVPLEQPETLTASDNGAVKIDTALKHQLRVLLLEKMKAAELPSDPRKRNPATAAVVNPPPVEPPPVEPPLKPVEMHTSTMRVASLVAGGLAIVSGLAALILGVMAQGDAAGVMTNANGELIDRSQVGKARDSITKSSAATVFGGLGAVAAVGALAMFIIGPAEEPVASVAPVVLGDGVGATVTWRLP